MLINNAFSLGGGVASMFSTGGLAGLARVSAGSTFSGLAIYLTGSNTLLDAVVDEFDLLIRSVFLAFVLNAVKNIKQDPEAMAKLKGR
jgi:hypothetical protein